MTDDEIRSAIVDYLWELRQHGKAALHQCSLARVVGVTPRRIEDAMNGDAIQFVCMRKHSGFRVLLHSRREGVVYRIAQEHAPADLLYVSMRWRQRITKGRRAIEELRVRDASPVARLAADGLAACLDQEEAWLFLLEDVSTV